MSDVVFATKEALFAALKGAFAGSRVAVSWADPGADQARRAVWFTETVEPEITPVAMVAGRRKPSTVTAEMTVRAVVAETGDPVHAERSAVAVKAVITDAVFDFDPASVRGLIDVRPVRTLTTNGEHAILGTASQVDVTLRVRAHALS